MPSQNTPDSLTLTMPNAPHHAAAEPPNLYQRALAAAQHAYAPYSHFLVGAALLTRDGHIVTGCNVENASFRLTTCAEQNAIAAAVALHGPHLSIQAIAIANLNDAASQPCGACRQTIAEFAAPDTRILYPAANGALVEATLADLLPASFQLTHEEPSQNLDKDSTSGNPPKSCQAPKAVEQPVTHT